MLWRCPYEGGAHYASICVLLFLILIMEQFGNGYSTKSKLGGKRGRLLWIILGLLFFIAVFFLWQERFYVAGLLGLYPLTKVQGPEMNGGKQVQGSYSKAYKTSDGRVVDAYQWGRLAQASASLKLAQAEIIFCLRDDKTVRVESKKPIVGDRICQGKEPTQYQPNTWPTLPKGWSYNNDFSLSPQNKTFKFSVSGDTMTIVCTESFCGEHSDTR